MTKQNLTGYLKNSVVAKKYGVHISTVANYIKGALEGKNLLKVKEVNGRYSILETETNLLELKNLSKKTLNYRRSNSFIDFEVKNKIYEILDDDKLLTLISAIETFRFIPLKYNYLAKGGDYWVKMHQEAIKSEAYPIGPSDDIHLAGIDYLAPLIENYDVLNFFDIGPGSGLPAVQIITKLLPKKINYIAIDISQVLLDYAKENVSKAIDVNQIFSYCIDIESFSLANVIHPFKANYKNSISLVLFAGGTLSNFSYENQIRAISNIKDGLFDEDYLFISTRVDNVVNRTSFPLQHNLFMRKCISYIASEIGLDKNLVDEEFIYNEKYNQREYNLVFTKDVSLYFKKFNKRILIAKGQKINLWTFKDETLKNISNLCANSNLKLQYYATHQFQPFVGYMLKTNSNNSIF